MPTSLTSRVPACYSLLITFLTGITPVMVSGADADPTTVLERFL